MPVPLVETGQLDEDMRQMSLVWGGLEARGGRAEGHLYEGREGGGGGVTRAWRRRD